MNKTNQTFPHSNYKKTNKYIFQKKNYIDNLNAKTYKIFSFAKAVLISVTSKKYFRILKKLIKRISNEYFTPSIIWRNYHH